MPADMAERRRYRRFDISCPITVTAGGGEVLARTTTVNVSCGGAFYLAPADRAPQRESVVEVSLTAPGEDRAPADFRCQATVVRHEAVGQEGLVGVALSFARSLPLVLEA